MSDFNEWNKAIIKEFRENGGKVGGQFENSDLILLHTIGAKSGLERINPVAYFTDNGNYVVIASKAGAPDNPDWYYNIVAHPQFEVEVGTEQFQVQATIAEEPDRTELYAKMVAKSPGFGEYQQKTERVIPVVVLSRLS
ncbi:MAG: nitroreductase family deazaflavin-dependent oxidoreductase [Anaerolineae bacterium]|nr:nitroreductase family deazaflavin-dependent oxidoreductase [Anaerolineae bacterium]